MSLFSDSGVSLHEAILDLVPSRYITFPPNIYIEGKYRWAFFFVSAGVAKELDRKLRCKTVFASDGSANGPLRNLSV